MVPSLYRQGVCTDSESVQAAMRWAAQNKRENMQGARLLRTATIPRAIDNLSCIVLAVLYCTYCRYLQVLCIQQTMYCIV